VLRHLPRKWKLSWIGTRLRAVNPYLGGFLTLAFFLGFALALPGRAGATSAGVILLMAVLTGASIWGQKLGLFVSVLAVAAHDFFFIPPVYSLYIDFWPDAFSLLIFALSAATVSFLAESLNSRIVAVRRSEMLTKRLYAFGQRLSEAQDLATVAHDTVASVGVAVGAKVFLLIPRAGYLAIAAAHPERAVLNDAESAAISKMQDRGFRWIGDFAPNGALTCTLLPIDNTVKNSAVLVVCETRRRFWQLPDRLRIIDIFSGPAAAAFKRVTLAKVAEEARIAAETERLRSALLTSISHDLKTPLAIVLGSASSLKEFGASLNETAAGELLSSILEEGERLNQFIANLLDMSRIEAEALRPKRQPAGLDDIAGSALRRAKRALCRHRVTVDISAGVPSIELDPVLAEAALFNILENAANYTQPGTLVAVTVSERENRAIIRIQDEGPGIPPEDLPHLFEKFYRGHSGEWKPRGTGLGLAIARGFVAAMGGTIAASNRKDRAGAVFTIEFPAGPARSPSNWGLLPDRASGGSHASEEFCAGMQP
jgi:two-component system, OmpR family, sensor histidine kinase KdpD